MPLDNITYTYNQLRLFDNFECYVLAILKQIWKSY